VHLKILKIRRKDRVLEYASIVHSYREGHKVKQRVLKNLGRIRSPEDLRKFNEILESMKREEKVLITPIKDIRVLNSLDFGIIYTVEKLWDAYGISPVLDETFNGGKFEFDATKIVELLVTRRLQKPSSDLSTHEWIQKEAFTVGKVIKRQHVYRTLDQLIKRKEKIEVGIFRELQRSLSLKADLVFYDLTSSYFEGEGPELAEHGKSRDHRPDLKQFVLALALIDGIPVFHEVFKGSTADKTTLKHAVKKLREHFEIERVIFVADRGLFSGENLDFLDEKDYEYIIATKRRRDKEVEELMLAPIETRKRVFAKEVKREGNRRYILCFNRDTEREQREHLREVRRSLKQKLRKLAESYLRKGPGKKPSQESIIRKAFETLGKHKRLFNVKFDRGLKFSLNRKDWEYENAIAGRFLIVTTSDLVAKRVMESYKELCSIERVFREIKSFVDIRPINHSKDRRVKAHVFECILAYLTEAMIGKLVPYQSARKTILELKRIKVTEMAIGDERMFLVREMKNSDLKIFNSLGVEPPRTHTEM
jgi:transposase